MNRRGRAAPRVALVGVVVGVCGAALGCGGHDLTASSKCSEYVQGSTEDRDTAVNKIAQDLNAPNAAGLGRHNIDNVCEREPDTTLGTVITRYRPAGVQPRVSPSDDGAPDTSDSEALHLLRTSNVLVPGQPAPESRGWQMDSVGVSGGDTARNLITAKVQQVSAGANILPDGVTLDEVSRLLDAALITVTPPDDYGGQASCIWCRVKVVCPDEQVPDRYSWVVTFPPEEESRDQYLAKATGSAAELNGGSAQTHAKQCATGGASSGPDPANTPSPDSTQSLPPETYNPAGG